MYFGDPYVVNVESAQGQLTLMQPTLDDIIKVGQEKFYQTLNILTTNTTQYRLTLWDMGIDWNTFSDFNLFLLLYKNLNADIMRHLIDGVDITTFEVYSRMVDDQETLVLCDPSLEIEINEEVYFHISQFFRRTFSVNPDEKLTKDPVMKEWFINKDRRQASIDQEKRDKGEEKDNGLLPLISACVNHPGFKYDLKTIRDLTMCQFYDCVHRLQIYENTTAIMKGMYSGFVDGSKIKPEDYNFMKNIK